MTDRALRALIDEIRNVVARRLPDQEIADEVAEVLREHRPAPADLLTAEQRRGHPEHYEQHVLHTDDDGSFSIVALVWRPEQRTSIHDHVTWCVVGVLEGTEQEALYKLSESGRPVEAETRVNHSGTVCGFAPPGDIHQVTNAGPGNAISLHVYGADISRLGTSIRREYELLAPSEHALSISVD